MTKVICNMCGKELDEWDLQESQDYSLHTKIGYGSKYDGNNIDLDLCCDYFDKLLDKTISLFKYSPIIEGE